MHTAGLSVYFPWSWNTELSSSCAIELELGDMVVGGQVHRLDRSSPVEPSAVESGHTLSTTSLSPDPPPRCLGLLGGVAVELVSTTPDLTSQRRRDDMTPKLYAIASAHAPSLLTGVLTIHEGNARTSGTGTRRVRFKGPGRQSRFCVPCTSPDATG